MNNPLKVLPINWTKLVLITELICLAKFIKQNHTKVSHKVTPGCIPKMLDWHQSITSVFNLSLLPILNVHEQINLQIIRKTKKSHVMLISMYIIVQIEWKTKNLNGINRIINGLPLTGFNWNMTYYRTQMDCNGSALFVYFSCVLRWLCCAFQLKSRLLAGAVIGVKCPHPNFYNTTYSCTHSTLENIFWSCDTNLLRLIVPFY